MSFRPRLARTSVLGALTALALSASMLAATSTADGAVSPGEAFFAPRLVTVDTPTRGDKDRLQQLGLDLTEHAGHDYVEVVLHTPADLAALTGAGFSIVSGGVACIIGAGLLAIVLPRYRRYDAANHSP